MSTLSPNCKKLIKILNDGKFHSGTDLGEKLTISRNAIWKHINRLSEFGVQIESIPGQGYCLAHPLILLDAKAIQKNLNNAEDLKLGQIHIFSQIKSTMDSAKADKTIRPNHIDIYLAEMQTQARGRFDRHWYSPFAANIYCSCRWVFNKDVSQLAGLSLVVGLALIKTLIDLGVEKNLALKWPNDLYYEEKKLGGILLEINATSHDSTHVILGIGLNINMPKEAAKNINRPWTALNQIMNQDVDRNKIIGIMLSHLFKSLSQFSEHGLAPFLSEWKQYDFLLNKNITLENGQQTINGIMRGIDQFGQLILQEADGKLHRYSAGETTIKTK